jgi:hypothetical protein
MVNRTATNRSVKATVYRAFADRVFLESSPQPGYELPKQLFSEWWLTWFWVEEELTTVDYRIAGLSLYFMAAMVEAGDA